MGEIYGGKGSVLAISLHPSGNEMWTGGSENKVFWWKRKDSSKWKLHSVLMNLAKSSKITSLAFCGDVGCLAVGSDEGYIALYHLPSSQWGHVFKPHAREIYTLYWRRAPMGQSSQRFHLSLDCAAL